MVLQILENSILSVSKSSHGKPDRPPHWKHFRAMVLPVFDKDFFLIVSVITATYHFTYPRKKSEAPIVDWPSVVEA